MKAPANASHRALLSLLALAFLLLPPAIGAAPPGEKDPERTPAARQDDSVREFPLEALEDVAKMWLHAHSKGRPIRKASFETLLHQKIPEGPYRFPPSCTPRWSNDPPTPEFSAEREGVVELELPCFPAALREHIRVGLDLKSRYLKNKYQMDTLPSRRVLPHLKVSRWELEEEGIHLTFEIHTRETNPFLLLIQNRYPFLPVGERNKPEMVSPMIQEILTLAEGELKKRGEGALRDLREVFRPGSYYAPARCPLKVLERPRRESAGGRFRLVARLTCLNETNSLGRVSLLLPSDFQSDFPEGMGPGDLLEGELKFRNIVAVRDQFLVIWDTIKNIRSLSRVR